MNTEPKTTGLSREGRRIAMIPALAVLGFIVWLGSAALLMEYIWGL